MDGIALNEDFADYLSQCAQRSEERNCELCLYVGVDLGGTNTRVAIGDSETFQIAAEFKCNSSRLLILALEAVAQQISQLIDCKRYIKAACLDAAGPVCQLGECVEITNYRSDEDNIHRALLLKDLPPALFPRGHSRIINDLESACYGISGLNSRTQIADYFKHFVGGEEIATIEKLPFAHHLVIAVGTGMGVGLMMALPKQDDFVVLSLEGGHVLLSNSPLNSEVYQEESEMVHFVSKEIYNGDHTLEYEDLVSGRGLEVLYKYFIQNTNAKDATAGEISQLALEGDEQASKALLYHYKFLARASANLAVCLGAKGIFWAGGNQITNAKFVEDNKEILYAEFLSHPKRAWIENLPIYVQTKDFNVNLEGTIHVSRVILQ